MRPAPRPAHPQARALHPRASPPFPSLNAVPRTRDAPARSSAPASRVSARSGAIPNGRAAFAAGRRERIFTARSRSSASKRRPTILVSARALPPTASASAGRGGLMPASARPTASDAARIWAAEGGSSVRWARVSRSEPTSADRTQAAPSSGVPTTTSVEPPPTSTTATTSGRSPTARATAPSYASRPSLSAVSTRTGSDVASASAAVSSGAAAPWRPGAVTITVARSTSSSAIRRA